MCEVNHIDAYVVALKSFAEVLALRQVFFDWMTNECNYALPLVLVHAMLQRQLSYLDSIKEV
jgi:hypothetical protein